MFNYHWWPWKVYIMCMLTTFINWIWCWKVDDQHHKWIYISIYLYIFHKTEIKATDHWVWKGSFFNLQRVLPRTISTPSTCNRSKCVNCKGPIRSAELLISCNSDDDKDPSKQKGAVASSLLLTAQPLFDSSASAHAVEEEEEDSVLASDCTTSDWPHSLLYSSTRVSNSWPSWIAFGILCKRQNFHLSWRRQNFVSGSLSVNWLLTLQSKPIH